MPHNRKTRSKSSATAAKSTRHASAKRKSTTSAAKKVVKRPASVKVVKRLRSAGRIARIALMQPVKGDTTLLRTSPEIKRVILGLGRSQGTIEASAYAPSSRARALLQGVKIAEADLKEAGGTFDLEEVQAVLNNVSRQAVEKRVKDGTLLAVPGPNNRRRYPTIQFTPEGVVPGLKDVQEALPTRNPWAVLNFLVRPDDRLDGRKPIEVLLNGDVDLVVSAARSMGEQGG